MVLHIIILFKVEIMMLRFPFTPDLYNFANYLSILCVPEYYTVLYPLRFGKGIHDSVGAKSPLKAKLIFKFLNMYM